MMVSIIDSSKIPTLLSDLARFWLIVVLEVGSTAVVATSSTDDGASKAAKLDSERFPSLIHRSADSSSCYSETLHLEFQIHSSD